MSPLILLGVALGGALGALARYGSAVLVQGLLLGGPLAAFPLSTLLVNVIGSFLLALLLFQEAVALPIALKTALGTGFLGALTTFSTFELDTFMLIRRGTWLAAGAYLCGNLLLGFAAVMAGRWLATRV